MSNILNVPTCFVGKIQNNSWLFSLIFLWRKIGTFYNIWCNGTYFLIDFYFNEFRFVFLYLYFIICIYLFTYVFLLIYNLWQYTNLQYIYLIFRLYYTSNKICTFKIQIILKIKSVRNISKCHELFNY